jgi:methylase of polypeptide subunit release factors
MGERLARHEKSFYDRRWEHAELSPADVERAAITEASITRDWRRILDMGCGDGRVSTEVSKALDCTIVGYDLSTAALAHCLCPNALGRPLSCLSLTAPSTS